MLVPDCVGGRGREWKRPERPVDLHNEEGGGGPEVGESWWTEMHAGRQAENRRAEPREVAVGALRGISVSVASGPACGCESGGRSPEMVSVRVPEQRPHGGHQAQCRDDDPDWVPALELEMRGSATLQ